MLKCPLPVEITLIFVGSDIPSNRGPETTCPQGSGIEDDNVLDDLPKPIAPHRQIECIIDASDNIEFTRYIASLGIQAYRCATHEHGTKTSHHLMFVEHFSELCDNLTKGLW
jgi:hypothetical protein